MTPMLLLLLTLAQPPAPAPPPPPPVWSGKAELSFVSTDGNTDTKTFATAAELDYKPAPWTASSTVAFLTTSVDDKRSARNINAGILVARTLSPRVEAYGQFGYARDRFAGILRRFAEEAGASYAAVATDVHTLKIRGGIGYLNETRVVGLDRSFATASLLASYKAKLSKTAEFTEDPSLILSLRDGDDWRAGNTISLTAAVNTVLSLKVSNRLTRLNAPVPGFKKTDVVTSAALVAKF